ncbi:MAG: TonB-dependent receptor [Sphingomonas sp.]|nr:MAG: TonB-dependent receptor [Sphingomonas sp.]
MISPNAARAAILLLWPSAVWAQQSASSFDLGTITVTGTRPDGLSIGSGALTSEAILAFERPTLDDAASLIPGVTAGNSGGSRNERLLFVRGFDRFQVPLSVDGIRIYLPADNRLDFGRFLTGDIAEIQVAKGYVPVVDGPGAMGGAVNLVTRTPGKEIEAEARATLSFDRKFDKSGYSLFGYAGTRQDRWYAQVSGTRTERDFFTLSHRFTPTANQAAGRRDLSDTQDWRVNARIGFTPSEGQEVALSYTKQEGAKNAPIETTVPLPVQRYWSWPEWNIETIALHLKTPLGDKARLTGKAYRSRFDNLLRSFDSRSQSSQTLGRSFNSWYDDEALGGSLKLDVDLTASQGLTIAAHVRQDEHVEWQQSFPSGFTEPKQTSRETTWSLAAEHRIALAPTLAFRWGASLDWRDLHQAQDYGTPPGGGASRVFDYERQNGDAWNAQGQIEWTPDDARRLALSVSSRARFPSLFERFSSRFGGATSNPGLKAERATQAELSGSLAQGPFTLEAAAYVARVSDAIFAVPALYYPCTGSTTPPPAPVPGCEAQAVSQSRNVGSGTYWGADGAITAAITATLKAGASLSFVERDIEDPNVPAFRPTGVPSFSGFLWADWQPIPQLSVLPSVDFATDRWLVNTAGTNWRRDGGHALANLRIAWRPRDGLELAAGARNLFDTNYELAEGFPEQGRNFTLSLLMRY